ncbi:MAG: RsmD family RNA methyltransferase [Planctomycetia bacterium]|nr:RsmD family RNA methyltransferase [Planctomycetia bacterium]
MKKNRPSAKARANKRKQEYVGDLPITPYQSSRELYRQLDDKHTRAARMVDSWQDSVDDEDEASAPDSNDKARKSRGKRNRNVGSEPGDRGDAVGLRVIGGLYRGTKLEYGGDRRVRPMKERVREAVFNLLGTSCRGKHVLDLFAGTGALGFEALSRGARTATLLEVHFPTARVTRRNIRLLEEKAPGISERIELITTDAFFWGRNLARAEALAVKARSPIERYSQVDLPTETPWLVFCSPPYDFWVERQEQMLELLQTLRQRAPVDSIFVIEADNRFDFDLLQAEINPKKRRSYPPAEVAIFTQNASNQQNA